MAADALPGGVPEPERSAERTLTDMGKTIQNELSRYTADDDTERRTRVQKILAELEEIDEDDELDPASARPCTPSRS